MNLARGLRLRRLISLRPCFAAALASGLLLASATQSCAAPEFEGFGDDLLTDDLDGLLEGLPELDDAPDTPPEGPPPAAAEPNPLERIASGMAAAKQLIASRGAPAETKRVQERVVTELDELIKQAEKQNPPPSGAPSQSQQAKDQQGKQRQQSQRSQPKPGEQAGGREPSNRQGGKPGRQAGDAKGSQGKSDQSRERLARAAAQSADGRPPQELVKEVWGRLPQRIREQMLESSSDEFLPQYRKEIERYFQRLAEQPE
ncbi:MAG: hypothetical protein AAGB00_04900 [Planctomycetota bacterium]